MNVPDRDSLLEALFAKFWHHLRAHLQRDLDSSVDPAVSGRLSAEYIFNSLDWCKDVLAPQYGIDVENLFSRAAPLEGTSWATQSMQVHGWKMLEYLIDFSISHGSIPMAIEQDGKKLPEGVKFELLLGAESELGYDKEICRDLMKLLDTRCRVKVLVYAARTSNAWISTIKTQLEAVFNNHASDPSDSAWLVVGIPTYEQFVKHQAHIDDLPRQVYVLGRENDKFVLLDKSDWWQL